MSLCERSAAIWPLHLLPDEVLATKGAMNLTFATLGLNRKMGFFGRKTAFLPVEARLLLCDRNDSAAA